MPDFIPSLPFTVIVHPDDDATWPQVTLMLDAHGDYVACSDLDEVHECWSYVQLGPEQLQDDFSGVPL